MIGGMEKTIADAGFRQSFMDGGECDWRVPAPKAAVLSGGFSEGPVRQLQVWACCAFRSGAAACRRRRAVLRPKPTVANEDHRRAQHVERHRGELKEMPGRL